MVYRNRRWTKGSLRCPEKRAVVMAAALLGCGSAALATPIPVADCLALPPTRVEHPAGHWGVGYDFGRAVPNDAAMPTPALPWNEKLCISDDAVDHGAAVRGRGAVRARAAATHAILLPGAAPRMATRDDIDDIADGDARERADATPLYSGKSQDSLVGASGSQPDTRAIGDATGLGGSPMDAIYSGSIGGGGSSLASAPASTATRRGPDRSPQSRGPQLWATADVAGSVTGISPWTVSSRVPNEDSWTPRLPLEGSVSTDRGSSTPPAATTVPEPGTLALFALGLLLFVGRRGLPRRG